MVIKSEISLFEKMWFIGKANQVKMLSLLQFKKIHHIKAQKWREATHTAAVHVDVGVKLNARRHKTSILFIF